MKIRFQKRARARELKHYRVLDRRRLGDTRIQWRIAFHTKDPIQYLIDCGELPPDYLPFVSHMTMDVRLPITEEDVRALTEGT